jgi:REP element-mobilizing transposase RayT
MRDQLLQRGPGGFAGSDFVRGFSVDDEGRSGYRHAMPRRLRIEFEGAIYHVMARGNARQRIVRDDADRHRLLDGLAHAVTRYDWELLSYVVMGNHLHLLLKTPRPNLAAGMQNFLSGYALWSARRRRRVGHLFQGRYRAEMIEDESYYWTVSRYIHLNPVRAGLVARPEHYEWSSYPGYCDPRRRQPWVAHEALLAAWRSDAGVDGSDAAAAYIGFVEAGLVTPPSSPFREAFGGWILGSQRFVARLREQSRPVVTAPPPPEARQLSGYDPEVICAAVADYYGLEVSALARRHDPHLARTVAASLCRRYTEAPHRALAERFGLSRADSVPNLTRRLEARLRSAPGLAEELEAIMQRVRAASGVPALTAHDAGPPRVGRRERRTKNRI